MRRARAGERGGIGRALGPPPPGLFADVLLDPARERVPGAAPVVSLGDDEDEAFRAEALRRARGSYALRRRGEDHGTLVELEPDGLLPPRARRRRREAEESQRWCAARPLLLPGAAESVVRSARAARPDPRRLFERLAAGGAGALRAWLEERLPQGFGIADAEAPLADPERDLGRVLLAGPSGESGLWVKLARLSTHSADRSLRVRVSFGREGEDDAAADPRLLRATTELARALFPGAAAAEVAESVRAPLERLVGGAVLYTQAILYANAPEGGTRFHHDAFWEDEAAEASLGGQRGVAFFQLDGESVWLALSIEDLAWRVRELVRWAEEGDARWLAEDLEEEGRWAAIRALAEAPRAELLRELALPGCGGLGALVDLGPAFTRHLADAGHALVLHPGDVLLLPNHGPSRTAMHAVFCGSPRPTHGLSLAIRRLDEEA